MPPPIRIDPQTAARVRACLDRCQISGADPVQALDQLGLLMYLDRANQFQRESLELVASILEEATLKSLAHPAQVPANALDTKKLIVEWLRQFAATVIRKKQ